MRRLPFALAGLACVLLASLGRAVDADPSKDYFVTPDAGPWMICAASYTGPEAAGKAHDLVLDLRRNYNLPAYVFNRGDKERREQEAERERMKKLYGPDTRVRTVRIQDQYAVLVGGYKDMDAAHKALQDVKKLKPSDTRLMNVLFAGAPSATEQAKDKKGGVAGASYVSPLMDAFVVRNPTVQQEKKPDKKNDPFLKTLNSDEEFSLLKCKEPWTLAVAAFQGTSVIQTQSSSTGFLNKFFGNSGGERLEASGRNAHNLAEVLRKSGFDAYVLHMRNGSIVAVGGYQRPDDPRMKEVQQALATRCRFTGNVELLPQPMPMEVPHP
jgi:hypothetical protein